MKIVRNEINVKGIILLKILVDFYLFSFMKKLSSFDIIMFYSHLRIFIDMFLKENVIYMLSHRMYALMGLD